MDLWFQEYQTEDMIIACRVRNVLHREKTPFQEVAVFDTVEFGRMLVLDNVIQTNIKDEFVYHEMITHVPLHTHPHPVKVLVVGGGDGGTVREVIKHPSVEKVVLCEIDGAVVAAAKKYLPEISCALDDPKVEVIIDDGIKHVRDNKDTYDLIVIDSTDPVGPAEGLFSAAFYGDIFHSLKEGGIFVAQTESPFFNEDLIRRVCKDVAGIFPLMRLYLANIPSYPGGLWTFTMGSKIHDPLGINLEQIKEMDTRFYNRAMQRNCFMLPPFVKALLK